MSDQIKNEEVIENQSGVVKPVNQEQKDQSEEIKEIVEETFESLDAVGYGKPMKAKFEELGIGEVWQNGKKKVDLINVALQKLADLRQKKEEGVESVEEAKEQIEQDNAEKAKLEEQAKEDEEQKELSEKEARIKKLIEGEMTKESLIGIMDNLESNIKGGNPHFKQQLIQDTAIYNAVLIEKYGFDYYNQ